jgi:hypothetical protein
MAIQKILWGCVKSILPPAAAKENFEWCPFKTIVGGASRQ